MAEARKIDAQEAEDALDRLEFVGCAVGRMMDGWSDRIVCGAVNSILADVATLRAYLDQHRWSEAG